MTDEEIKAIWKSASSTADFSRGPVWNVPIRRSWKDAYERAKNTDPTKPTPADDMYIAFRLEEGAYGVSGGVGHRLTRVTGRGVVVEEVHHHDMPVFIPLTKEQTP